MKKTVRVGKTVIIKENGLFFEKGTELKIDEVTEEKIYLKKDEYHSIRFQVSIEDFHRFLELKQPKDPNELIGRRVKGFRFDSYRGHSINFNEDMTFEIGNVGKIVRFYPDNTGYAVTFDLSCNTYTYPADQIEAHLLPEKKTKKERIEELEKIVSDLQKRVKSLEEEKTITICTNVNHREDGVIEVTLDDVQKQAPEFWYIKFDEKHPNIEEFKELFVKLSDSVTFFERLYGYSGRPSFNGFDFSVGSKPFDVSTFDCNQDKMVEVTIEEAIEIMNNFKPSYKAPEFWYVDIVEEKDSELLPKFKEWYNKVTNGDFSFCYKIYGFFGYNFYNNFDFENQVEYLKHPDKMQKITLNEWDKWFNK